jgi:hypothetical protein
MAGKLTTRPWEEGRKLRSGRQGKNERAFLNLFARPDSDFAARSHRDASSAGVGGDRVCCGGDAGPSPVWREAARGTKEQKFFGSFFQKRTTFFPHE